MRITLKHHKDKQSVIKDVDAAFDKLSQGPMPGPLRMDRFERQWSGGTMKFSCFAQVGPFSSPIKGYVDVTDDELTIDCDLPLLLTKIVPESAIKAGVESKIKGLLT